ncbi:MAG: PRD domain-containing protein [Erysipelotrichaceae bacterium]|nr:PRD domain-containing protein [Erysipelotrichaceae bacterium]
MKVIKSINNNISHCVDSKGREVVAFGKGIGFFKPDEEIPLDRINRTFYNVKDTDYGVLRNIPTVLINTAIFITDYVAEELNVNYPSSMALVLADHLDFAITRKDKNIYLEQPILMDIAQLYPDEMRVALESLNIIKKMTGETLPQREAGTLALHFVSDRIETRQKPRIDITAITEECTRLIEKELNTQIDRTSFNYNRFVTHLDYLIRRLETKEQIDSQNRELYEQIKNMYPDSFTCATKLAEYIHLKTEYEINDEEVLYLAVHINRMISRI